MAGKTQDTPVMITILGPTATGKTTLAAHLAADLEGEIISADSRQVYRGMDLGTGKDLADYVVDGKVVPNHLVDIADAGTEYNVYRFQQDFLDSYHDIVARKKIPLLCGGTGMYLEAVLAGYRLVQVPQNQELRLELKDASLLEISELLKQNQLIHNTTDTNSRERAVRALEIALFNKVHKPENDFPIIGHKIFGIRFEREVIRQRITQRLQQRLEEGMLGEVQDLLDGGLKPEQLTFYGLEYRYLTDHLCGKLTYDEMFRLLNTAIHQFAKRQMTWFRRMEKKGFDIHWIEGGLPTEQKIALIKEHL